MVLRGLLTFSILMCVQVAVNADTDPSDASALNVLFQSMNNPAELAGWSASGNDPCGQSWKGVTCSGSRVTQIKLPGLGVAGSLGYQLTSLTSLTELDVSNNNLGGTIPYNLPPHLQRLNLGNNNFSGGIPYSISQMPTLTYLNIGHNQLNELLEDMFGQLSSLATMDISHNSIPGPLPQSLSNLSNINSLYLQNNQFTGTIDVLANLTTLQNLNVANNHFTGGIPEALQNINIQRDGNSWNTGPAPPSPPGSPHYTRTHSASKSRSDESAERRRKSGLSGGGIAGIVISIILVVVGAITAFLLIKQRSREPQQGDVEKVDDSKNVKRFITIPSNEIQTAEKTIQTFSSIKTIDPAANISLKPPPLGPQKSFDREKEVSVLSNSVVKSKSRVIPPNVKSYSIADLQIATCSFSYENLLGEGSLGSVYRAEFENENVLAVKKVNSSAVSNCCEDFTEIVANISRLHHPNITELVGYCSEHGQHLLVYEFHKNGSLHEFMHLPDEQQNKPLSWQSRVKIALGSARALEYLHETCSPPVVHRNFKSENILLDGELSPHVSDSGLAIFLPDVDQRIDHNCCAPEVADIGEYTMKSDVYGFGVVMLELLTGRKPFDSSRPRSKQSLVRWATPQLHDIDALTNMVDPLLEGLYPVKSLSRFADVIALCLQPEPEFRPPMSEVVQALVQLAQRANLSRRTTF